MYLPVIAIYCNLADLIHACASWVGLDIATSSVSELVYTCHELTGLLNTGRLCREHSSTVLVCLLLR